MSSSSAVRSACVIAALVTAAIACGGRESSDAKAVAKMRAFVERMCACDARVCTEGVQQDHNRWNLELTEHTTRIGPKARQELDDLAEQYNACLLTHTESATAPADPTTDPALTAEVPTAMKVVPPVARLFDEARLRAPGAWTGLTIQHVRPDGTLDATHGAVRIETGAIPPADDDPGRALGAPAAVPHAWTCMTGVFDVASGWRWLDADTCGGAAHPGAYRAFSPRCTAIAVWTKARAAGAPDGVATMTLMALERDRQAWVFELRDPVRGVRIHLELDDDCASPGSADAGP